MSSANILLSFIVPSYNSAHTVMRCLDSIYSLSLKHEEFEVIFIDDCSADNTCEVVIEYQKQHPNITLLRQPKNQRQGAARNRGVSTAKGEYICFVDSDDTVTKGIVNAIRLAKEKQMDMVAFHYQYVNEQGELLYEAEHLPFPYGYFFSGIKMQNIQPYWCSAPWAYIYRKMFLDKANYPFHEDVLYEDSDFVAAHLYYAERIAYSPELSYLVYCREGSTTRSVNYKGVADYLLLGTRMMELYEKIENRGFTVESKELEKFADSILEGACWNVEKSCKRIIKLKNLNEVYAYYLRVDEMTNRKVICGNEHYKKYYWTSWTLLCLKHKWLTIMILSVVIPIYKLVK